MTAPLTARERAAMAAITRGQVSRHPPPKPGAARIIQHPAGTSRQVIHALVRKQWARWAPTGDPDLQVARPTQEGVERLRAPTQPTARFLRIGLAGSINADRCVACNHPRGAHGTHPATGEHAECMECDCHRFRARTDDQDHDHGYTHAYDALNAGECVDTVTQRKLTDQARDRDRRRHRTFTDRAAQIRELLADEQRLVALHNTAKRRHINVSSELGLVRMMLRAGRRDAALRRLRVVEQHVDRA